MFSLKLSTVRRKTCNSDKRKVDAMERLVCPHKIIRLAGWHFSYVLSDAGIQKKIRASADNADSEISKKSISNFTSARWGGVFGGGFYTKDFGLFQANLPDEIVNDVIKNRNKSKYAEYLAGIDYSSLDMD